MTRARDLADRVLHNRTHEDTDGGRESIVTFKGEQSGGEISTLAQIQASHDGTADDQKADLIFKTNDGSDNAAPTERLRIDSAGVTSVSGSLTLDNSGQSQSLVSVGGGSTNAALTLRGSTGSAYAWQISSNAHVASALEFTRSSAVGNTTFSSPKLILDNDGLKFNGDTAAANALNDYEEGTWSPVLVGAGGGTKAGVGSYVKIGRTQLVTCTFNSIGTGLSGNLTITGIPFTINPSNSSTLDQYVPLQWFNLNWDNSAKAVYGYVADNGTTIVPYYSLDTANSTIVQGSHLVTDTYLRFTQVFETT